MTIKLLFRPIFLLAILLIFSVFISIFAVEDESFTNTIVENKEPACQDFLENINKKPKNLDFIECKKTVLHGDPALESKYRVKGSNALEVEAYFVKTAHMPVLRNICCGWESLPENPATKHPYGIYKSDENTYIVSMDSGETLITQRSNWYKIPYFNVTVILYLDSP